MPLPSLSPSAKQPRATRFLRYETQTTVADSQPLLDVIPVGPIEIKSPAASIGDLIRLVATARPQCQATVIDDQVLSLP